MGKQPPSPRVRRAGPSEAERGREHGPLRGREAQVQEPLVGARPRRKQQMEWRRVTVRPLLTLQFRTPSCVHLSAQPGLSHHLLGFPLGTMTDVAEIRVRLKRTIVESLMLEGMTPEEIGDEETLFGDGLGLDSVDALELVLGIEQEFGVKIGNDVMDRSAFATVATLADFVLKIQSAQAAGA